MSIEGRIAIDVNFADSSDSTGVQSLKKISLVDTTSYTTGKVALLTGTCGTAEVAVPVVYTNAAGEAVAFTAIRRIAISASRAVVCKDEGGSYTVIASGNRVSVSDADSSQQAVLVRTTSGTATYTLVLYGT